MFLKCLALLIQIHRTKNVLKVFTRKKQSSPVTYAKKTKMSGQNKTTVIRTSNWAKKSVPAINSAPRGDVRRNSNHYNSYDQTIKGSYESQRYSKSSRSYRKAQYDDKPRSSTYRAGGRVPMVSNRPRGR